MDTCNSMTNKPAIKFLKFRVKIKAFLLLKKLTLHLWLNLLESQKKDFQIKYLWLISFREMYLTAKKIINL